MPCPHRKPLPECHPNAACGSWASTSRPSCSASTALAVIQEKCLETCLTADLGRLPGHPAMGPRVPMLIGSKLSYFLELVLQQHCVAA
eukprot:1333716-Amphidinium_carterae.1